MKQHRSTAAIEISAAAITKAMAQVVAEGRNPVRYEQALIELRIEWREARAHDCEQYDGECIEWTGNEIAQGRATRPRPITIQLTEADMG